jgi:hypothetical protein
VVHPHPHRETDRETERQRHRETETHRHKDTRTQLHTFWRYSKKFSLSFAASLSKSSVLNWWSTSAVCVVCSRESERASESERARESERTREREARAKESRRDKGCHGKKSNPKKLKNSQCRDITCKTKDKEKGPERAP